MSSRDLTLDLLGYGSHLIIDGFGADAGALGDKDRLVAVLKEIARSLEEVPATEAGDKAELAVETPDGPSCLLALGESQLSLHAFVRQRALSLHAFSRWTLEPETLVGVLSKHLSLGRVESYLTSRSRTYHEKLDLEALLRGERSYTCARLDETLVSVEPRT